MYSGPPFNTTECATKEESEMDNYCVVCLRKFPSDKASKICSDQCQEIYRKEVKLKKHEWQFQYADKRRNRVFEVCGLERAKEIKRPQYNSLGFIRQQGAGSEIRITSR